MHRFVTGHLSSTGPRLFIHWSYTSCQSEANVFAKQRGEAEAVHELDMTGGLNTKACSAVDRSVSGAACRVATMLTNSC